MFIRTTRGGSIFSNHSQSSISEGLLDLDRRFLKTYECLLIKTTRGGSDCRYFKLFSHIWPGESQSVGEHGVRGLGLIERYLRDEDGKCEQMLTKKEEF